MLTHLKSRATAIALTCLLAACGCSSSSGVDSLIAAGNSALGAGDSISAQSKFDEALHRMQTDDAKYVEAKVGLIRARVSAYASIAVEEFLLLAQDRPDFVGEREFKLVVEQMVIAKKAGHALTVVCAGPQHFREQDFLTHSGDLQSAGDILGAGRIAGAGVHFHGESLALKAQFEQIKELVQRDLSRRGITSGQLKGIYCQF